MHLTIQGIKDGQWRLKNSSDWNNPLIQHYLRTEKEYTLTSILFT